jgi:hypothetical protein
MTVLANVDFAALWQVIWVSLLAGVTVSALFAVVVRTSARASDARRGGHGGAAAALAVLAGFALLLFAAGVVIGVQVMLTK